MPKGFEIIRGSGIFRTMKVQIIQIAIAVFLVLSLGCSTSKKETTKETPDSNPTITLTETQSVEPGGLLGDSTMFPFVYQGEGKSVIFEAYTMRFQLTHQDPLVPMVNINVPWIDPSAFNENNGLFINYVQNGKKLSLENPYIQVQYINKNLKSCGTVDSVYMWLDEVLINKQGGEVLRPMHSVSTPSRKDALVKEYQTPNMEQRKGKYLAYAYIDYNDEYIIGFGLTTLAKSDYEITQPLFYELVKSFSL